jgi:hypothetical protein
VRRFLATVGDALRPVASAPSMRGQKLRPALAFALLTAAPIALLRGVVPYTHRIEFGPRFAIEVLGDPTQRELVLDVLFAMTLSLAETSALLLASIACHTSLCKAYGGAAAGVAALRTGLYRAFLVPLTFNGLPFWILIVGTGSPEALGGLLALLELVPLVLLFVSHRNAARRAGELPPLASYAAAILPLVLMILTEALVRHAMAPLLPAGMAGP